MLRDRACPQGGWNAGNGTVFGAALTPHIDATAIGLLAVTEVTHPTLVRSLNWLRQACAECSSAYSLAWAALALLMHQDPSRDHCIGTLRRVLSSRASISNTETLSLAVIAINVAEENINPFQAVI
jgi:hypothetical protein